MGGGKEEGENGEPERERGGGRGEGVKVRYMPNSILHNYPHFIIFIFFSLCHLIPFSYSLFFPFISTIHTLYFPLVDSSQFCS